LPIAASHRNITLRSYRSAETSKQMIVGVWSDCSARVPRAMCSPFIAGETPALHSTPAICSVGAPAGVTTTDHESSYSDVTVGCDLNA